MYRSTDKPIQLGRYQGLGAPTLPASIALSLTVHMRFPLLLATAALLAPPAHAASPWPRGQLHGFTHLNFSYFSDYNAVAAPGGGDVSLPRVLTNYTLSAYGQLGIAPRSDLVVDVPVKILATHTQVYDGPTLNQGSLTAIGDISLGLGHQFFSIGGWAMGGQVDVTLPTSTHDEATGLRSGLGTFALTPSLAVGRGWSKAYFLVNSKVTTRAPLSQDYTSTFGAGIEAGYSFFDRIWLAAVLDSVLGLADGSPGAGLGYSNAGVYLDAEQYFVAGGKVAGAITPNFGLTLGAYKTIWSVFTPRAFGLNVGMYAQW